MGKPARDRALSPVNPGDSATREEVCHEGSSTRSRWEDITWPDQVAFRGRRASSTRKVKPQTTNQPARVPREGMFPDASSSGSVCKFSALVSGRQGAELGCEAGDGLVLHVPEPWSWCGRNTNSADRACTAARVGDAACAALGSPGGTCAAMVGVVVAR